MTATTAVALAGIAAAGVLGPGLTAFLAGIAQRREFRHQVEVIFQEDLRRLLDSAAETLGIGVTNLRAMQEVSDHESSEIGAWSSQVHLIGERLILRLGSADPVVTAYQQAQAALTQVARVLGNSDPRKAEEVDREIQRFEDARRSFLEAARELISND